MNTRIHDGLVPCILRVFRLCVELPIFMQFRELAQLRADMTRGLLYDFRNWALNPFGLYDVVILPGPFKLSLILEDLDFAPGYQKQGILRKKQSTCHVRPELPRFDFA